MATAKADAEGAASETIETVPPLHAELESHSQTNIIDILHTVDPNLNFNFEEEKRVLRKIDSRILPIILFAYFLQQMDKSSLSYSSVFGIQEDAGLVGLQYSWLGSSLYLAQLVMQPIGAFLLVKLPTGKVIGVAIFLWGVSLCGMAGSRNFHSLLASRVLLGSFEAMIAPSLIAVTQMWWRRSEQTNRIAAWSSMNGLTFIVGSLITWGLGHAKSSVLHPYQIIFLFCGCLTLAFSVIALTFMPDSPMEAKFWKEGERDIAIQRLRANQMGVVSRKWRWDHARESALDLKTWCWFFLVISISIVSGGIGTFGSLIIAAFGFDKFTTILFNIPFGVVQIISILGGGWLASRIKSKAAVITLICIPSIIGCVMLLKVPRPKQDPSMKGVLLFGYYLLSFYPGITPLIFSWSSQNTAGDTKRKTTTGVLFVGLCTGNVIGPLLYQSKDAPIYFNGLVVNLAMFCLVVVLCGLITLYLKFLNKRHAATRESLGKSAFLVDESMIGKEKLQESGKGEMPSGGNLGDKSFNDVTDFKNEDFIYVY